MISDGAGWSLDWDAKYVAGVFDSLGLRKSRSLINGTLFYFTSRDHFIKFEPLLRFLPRKSVIVDHFHGVPNDDFKYEKYFEAYARLRDKLYGVRVTNLATKAYFESKGLGDLVEVIKIPVDTTLFKDEGFRTVTRQEIGINDSDTLIGSFQKDGIGWEKGETPKLEKGPDILIEALEILSQMRQDIFVLLTGPSRGYVYDRLRERGVRVSWVRDLDYESLPRYYSALDLYLITSRLEGGPKSALEALACGTPLVSTPVGQVPELGITNCEGEITTSFSATDIASAAERQLRLPRENHCGRNLAYKHNLQAFAADIERWLSE